MHLWNKVCSCLSSELLSLENVGSICSSPHHIVLCYSFIHSCTPNYFYSWRLRKAKSPKPDMFSSSNYTGNRVSGHTHLDWETRSGIALDVARGIEYIHSLGPGVSHGNIKSSNILLGKSLDAHVAEHGLANLIGPSSTPNRAAGYIAPEVTDVRKVPQKGDVYSFGVLLLELLTGRAPVQAYLNEEGIDLPRWVRSIAQEEWTSEVFELELLRFQNADEDMVQLLQLALDCAADHPDKRPSMSEVVVRIEEICRSSQASARRNQQQEHHGINGSVGQSS